MKTGNLTHRGNTTIRSRRYTGSFGQPDGFGSVLEVTQRGEGTLILTLTYKLGHLNTEQTWSVELTNEQRNDLAKWIGEYQPTLFEDIDDGRSK